MSAILECSGLTKAFGNKTALSNINLKLERGQIVGLLGPNGSGKTTFIKLVNDLLTPTSGEIRIAGMKPGVETKKIVSSVLIILEGLLLCIISLASGILIIYASMALGHLADHHRILVSLAAFLTLNTITQILMAILMIIPGSIGFTRNILTFGVNGSGMAATHFAVWYFIGFYGALTAGYFIITNYIMGKRLNLE